jgi:hypothetical protein
MRPFLAPVVLAAALSGCGYFNSLYNANRQFADAERAAARGDVATSRVAFRTSIDKAAVSYRGHPQGRWSADALLLIGRARFALGEDEEAAAAMRHLLSSSASTAARALANAYLGASLVRLDSVALALPHLDSAVAELKSGTDHAAFARLWRARASFHLGNAETAWPDLEQAAAHPAAAVEASLEIARRAVAARDSARLAYAAARLAALRDGERTSDDLALLLHAAAGQWSPAVVLQATAPLERTAWRADAANHLSMARAEIAHRAGDPANATRIAMTVAQTTRGGAGSRARVLAATWRLEDAQTVGDLEQVERLLLAAYDDGDALDLLRRTRAVQLLATRGMSPAASISLFAAAELALEIGAPLLAHALFLDFVALVPDSPWAGKAALAAHAIAPDDRTRRSLSRLEHNPYVRATAGSSDNDDLSLAEQRLARGITGLRADALAEVVLRDVGVSRALSALDSSRSAARSDSLRVACGSLIDSLQVRGVRADSVRGACLRGDSERVTLMLRADSTALQDSARAAAARPRPVQPPPDTLHPRRP